MKLLDAALQTGSSWPDLMPAEEFRQLKGTEVDEAHVLRYDPKGGEVPFSYKQGNRRMSYVPMPALRSDRVQGIPATLNSLPARGASSKRTLSEPGPSASQAKRRAKDVSNASENNDSTDTEDEEVDDE
jgi:hypothetical protein